MRQAFFTFGPQQASFHAAIFFDLRGEVHQLLNVLLDENLIIFVERNVVAEKRRIQSQVDADVTVLFIAAIVEFWSQASDTHDANFFLPDGVEQAVALRIPKFPGQFELIRAVVMQDFGGFRHGHFRCCRLLVLGKIDALECGRLLPVQWIDGSSGDQGMGELMHHLGELFR